jgi:type I restriction enzyme S subunit
MKDNYKKTKLGWIPKDWEIGKIKDFLIEHKGGAALRPSDFVEKDGFKVIPKKAISAGGVMNINLEKPKMCSLKFAKKNEANIINSSYLVTTLRDLVPSGPNIGYIVKFNSAERFILSQGVYGLKINKEISSDFLIHYSNTSNFRKVMQTIMVGSTQVHIRNSEYFNVQIPLPPLPEQQKIAKILSTIDAKLNNISDQITATQTLKKGLMQQLLTEGIGHSEFKDSKLGRIPNDWEVVKLKDVARCSVGIASSATHAYRSSGVPLIRNQNIKEGKLDLSDILYVSEEYEQLHKSKRLKEDDILTVRTGYPGISAVVPKKLENAQSFTTLIIRRTTDIFTSEFLCYFMNSDLGKSFFNSNQAGGGQQNVGSKTLEKLSFPLPPLSEQKKIATILSKVDEKLSVLDAQQMEYGILKKGMMQVLLTGEVRVN